LKLHKPLNEKHFPNIDDLIDEAEELRKILSAIINKV
jgi:hypothetical protein